MSARLTIAEMQSVARHYGGKCLSKEYENWFAPLKWMCEKGHTWDNSYFIVRQGWWCSQCVKHKEKEEALEEVKKIAKKNGGICLSEKYVTDKTKLKFQCVNGHKWEMPPNEIKRNRWCVKCNLEKANELRFEKIKRLAEKKGGKCLTLKYINNRQNLKWQCSKGHTWIMRGLQINAGSWCEQCRKDAISDKIYKKISAFAEKKGGKCLSLKYVNKKSKLKWQCAKGHKWSAIIQNIRVGQWCPECGKEKRRTGLRKYSIASLKQIVKKRKFKLLSKEYININLPLTWECDKGHIWETNVQSLVIQGTGCMKCLHQSMKLSIEEFRQIAIERKGKLLSKEYISNGKRLDWQCEKGHKWSAVAANVKKGGWCPVCYHNKRRKNPI